MPRLNNSNVWRAGLTARHWGHGTNIVRISSDKNGLAINFSIPSKGGGITQTKTNIAVADFETIVRQMIASNEAEALKIMSAIIAEHHS